MSRVVWYKRFLSLVHLVFHEASWFPSLLLSSSVVVVLAGISVLIATINIAGGFLVTHRMLRMFQKS